MRIDDLDFAKLRKELQALNELFVDYVKSTAQAPDADRPAPSPADTVAMIGLRERMSRAADAVHELLEMVEEIAQAGGMEPFLRAHMPSQAQGNQEKKRALPGKG